MKIAHLLIAIPVFVFLSLSVTLDLQTLVLSYPDYDFTPYLAAQSLAKDLDLACAPVDSDRFFREWGMRPSGFRVADRRVLFASGDFRVYPVFYEPDLFLYLLVPFVGFLGFHGWMLFHALLILVLYLVGYFYHRRSDEEEGTLPAVNSVLYYTLFPLPVLFLLPTHHLYLFAVVSAAMFLGLRGRPVWSALLFGLAFSTQPWVLLVGALLIAYWQYSGLKSEFVRFIPVLAVSVAAVLGLKFLMYPGPDVTNIRWIKDAYDSSGAAFQTALSQPWISPVTKPSLQRVSDFVFGRTIGLIPYAAVTVCLLLSSIWMWRDRLVNRTLVFAVLLLVAVSITPPESWGIYGFANDLCLLLAAAAYFAAPIARPRSTLILIFVAAAVFAGPILANPLGAWTSRNYYLQSNPYRMLPIELSLVGKYGITRDPAHQFAIPQGKIYFLNDNFYPEGALFWVHGQSSLELLVEMQHPPANLVLQLIAGPEPNNVLLNFGGREEVYHLQASEKASLDLSNFASHWKSYEGRSFLHGTIQSSSGFVPRLLSRENPDFRYLGCQVRFAGNPAGK